MIDKGPFDKDDLKDKTEVRNYAVKVEVEPGADPAAAANKQAEDIISHGAFGISKRPSPPGEEAEAIRKVRSEINLKSPGKTDKDKDDLPDLGGVTGGSDENSAKKTKGLPITDEVKDRKEKDVLPLGDTRINPNKP